MAPHRPRPAGIFIVALGQRLEAFSILALDAARRADAGPLTPRGRGGRGYAPSAPSESPMTPRTRGARPAGDGGAAGVRSPVTPSPLTTRPGATAVVPGKGSSALGRHRRGRM